MATEKRLDLIDRNALDKILKNFEIRYQKACFALSAKAIADARQIVYAMKTVDAVEVVHGRWRKYTDERLNGYDNEGRIRYRKVYSYECSNCGRNVAVKSNYCPNCGADMRERKDND